MRPLHEAQRPATLDVALALTALTGLANLVVGGALLTSLLAGALPKRPGLSSTTLLTAAVTYLLLGTLTVAGAYGLFAGKARSRLFVTVVMMLRMAVATITVGVIGTWYATGSVIGLVVAFVVVALLWDSRANAYFQEPQ